MVTAQARNEAFDQRRKSSLELCWSQVTGTRWNLMTSLRIEDIQLICFSVSFSSLLSSSALLTTKTLSDAFIVLLPTSRLFQLVQKASFALLKSTLFFCNQRHRYPRTFMDSREPTPPHMIFVKIITSSGCVKLLVSGCKDLLQSSIALAIKPDWLQRCVKLSDDY